MATIGQIRGMILEEVVLTLLRTTGFSVVEAATGNDPTLQDGRSGLEVRGRGEWHQVDALADFHFPMPFGYPTRLVVEAKCFSPGDSVGLPYVRNAVGVAKDLNEFFVPVSHRASPSQNPFPSSNTRYHYRYAMFSATQFTAPAQRYAFAQDIYLVPYTYSGHLATIIQSIHNLSPQDFGATDEDKVRVNLQTFRKALRRSLREASIFEVGSAPIPLTDHGRQALSRLIQEASRIGGTLIGIANNQFMLHLIPSSQETLSRILELTPDGTPLDVSIHFSRADDYGSWYLEASNNPNIRLSFDLPETLFRIYADSGILSPQVALNMKESELSIIEAAYIQDDIAHRIVFKLDLDWIETVRREINALPE